MTAPSNTKPPASIQATPGSGTAMMADRPEIRSAVSAGDATELASIQRDDKC